MVANKALHLQVQLLDVQSSVSVQVELTVALWFWGCIPRAGSGFLVAFPPSFACFFYSFPPLSESPTGLGSAVRVCSPMLFLFTD